MTIRLAHGKAVTEKLPGVGWYLTEIYVEREYRGKGIGSRLMRKVLERCGRPIYLLATGEFSGDPQRSKPSTAASALSSTGRARETRCRTTRTW